MLKLYVFCFAFASVLLGIRPPEPFCRVWQSMTKRYKWTGGGGKVGAKAAAQKKDAWKKGSACDGLESSTKPRTNPSATYRKYFHKWFKYEGAFVPFAFWNIGVLETWRAKKREEARDAVDHFCSRNLETGAPESLVFFTADNGDHEFGLFTEKHRKWCSQRNVGNRPPTLRDPTHPMNQIIRVRAYNACLHAGSSSAAFIDHTLLGMKVRTIPLFNWGGGKKSGGACAGSTRFTSGKELASLWMVVF